MAIQKVAKTQGEIRALHELILSTYSKSKENPVEIPEAEVLKVIEVDPANGIRRVPRVLAPSLRELGIRVQYDANRKQLVCILDEKFNIQNQLTETDIDQGEVKPTITNFGHPYLATEEYFLLSKMISSRLDPASPFNESIYVYGPFGCGKDHAIEFDLARRNIEYIREPLTMYPNIQEARAALLGRYELVSDESGKQTVTKFMPGLIPRCAMENKTLILDELDRMHKGSSMIFQHIIEAGAKLTIRTEKGYEYFDVGKNFMIIFTGNTNLYGDTTGFFNTAQIFDHSLQSRLVKIPFTYHIEIEAALTKNLIPPAVHTLLFAPGRSATEAGIFVKIRELIDSKEINALLSTRQIMQFAKNYKTFGWHRSFWLFIIEQFHPDFRNSILDIIRTRIGGIKSKVKPSVDLMVPTMDEDIIKEAEPELLKRGF